MKVSRLVFAIILIISMGSCKQQLTKVVEQKYPDGSPQLERYFKEDGQKKELVKEVLYWPNKTKKIEGGYQDSLRDGRWTAWFENGNKWSEGNYIKGVEDGLKNVWYESGKLFYSGQFKNGKKIGIWKIYDEKGVLAQEIDYDKKSQ
jgi:antitoxin component YwqK of YwqJK toxin-antitoxin module